MFAFEGFGGIFAIGAYLALVWLLVAVLFFAQGIKSFRENKSIANNKTESNATPDQIDKAKPWAYVALALGLFSIGLSSFPLAPIILGVIALFLFYSSFKHKASIGNIIGLVIAIFLVISAQVSLFSA